MWKCAAFFYALRMYDLQKTNLQSNTHEVDVEKHLAQPHEGEETPSQRAVFSTYSSLAHRELDAGFAEGGSKRICPEVNLNKKDKLLGSNECIYI